MPLQKHALMLITYIKIKNKNLHMHSSKYNLYYLHNFPNSPTPFCYNSFAALLKEDKIATCEQVKLHVKTMMRKKKYHVKIEDNGHERERESSTYCLMSRVPCLE